MNCELSTQVFALVSSSLAILYARSTTKKKKRKENTEKEVSEQSRMVHTNPMFYCKR